MVSASSRAGMTIESSGFATSNAGISRRTSLSFVDIHASFKSETCFTPAPSRFGVSSRLLPEGRRRECPEQLWEDVLHSRGQSKPFCSRRACPHRCPAIDLRQGSCDGGLLHIVRP